MYSNSVIDGEDFDQETYANGVSLIVNTDPLHDDNNDATFIGALRTTFNF